VPGSFRVLAIEVVNRIEKVLALMELGVCHAYDLLDHKQINHIQNTR
jgi:hypothetical protein